MRYDFSYQTDSENGSSIETTEEGNLVIGNLLVEGDYRKIQVREIDYCGKEVWRKEFGASQTNSIVNQKHCSAKTYNSDFVICGSSMLEGVYHFYSIRIDSDGNIVWQKTYDLLGQDRQFGEGVIALSDGFLLFGKTIEIQDEYLQIDGLVIRIDLEGNELWRKQIGSYGRDIFYHGAECSDGSMVLSGTSTSFSLEDERDYWLVKINTVGDVLWEKNTDLGVFENEPPLIINGADEIFVFGKRITTYAYEGYHFFEKISADGEVLDYFEYPEMDEKIISSVKLTSSGNFVAVSNDFSRFGSPMIHLFDSLGNRITQTSYTERGLTCRLYDILENEDGSIASCGYSAESLIGSSGPILDKDTWVIKVDENGCLIPGCNSSTIADDELIKFRVHPNPVKNGKLNILVEASEELFQNSGHFILRDLSGREFINELYYKTNPYYIFDISAAKPGIYSLELWNTKDLMHQEKVIVLE